MNKIKLLALDLDGTTLTSKNTLAPAVKSALEKAIENGIIIAIATGRPLGTMPQSILDIEGIDYLIGVERTSMRAFASCVSRLCNNCSTRESKISGSKGLGMKASICS